jgi:hypothetical protein
MIGEEVGVTAMRLGFASILAIMFCMPPASAIAQESPKDIIAAQLRLQGYKCDAPRSAKRDVRASRPDEAVWLVSCEDARYRVRLVPDMAAIVEPL